MAQVEVSINGRDYRLACEDGQEQNLSDLAAYLNGRVEELVAEVGQIGDTSLLVMAGLLVADELSDALGEGDGVRPDEAALSEQLNSLAAGLEAVATQLEANAG